MYTSIYRCVVAIKQKLNFQSKFSFRIHIRHLEFTHFRTGGICCNEDRKVNFQALVLNYLIQIIHSHLIVFGVQNAYRPLCIPKQLCPGVNQMVIHVIDIK